MKLEYQIVAAMALDLVFGDPRWFPHPVRLIGKLAAWLELPARRIIVNPKIAGLVVVLVVVGLSGFSTWILLITAGRINPILEGVLSIYLLYSGIALKDMINHSTAVYDALRSGSTHEARLRVGMICGRDTDNLSEPEIVRAAVESIAENAVDGVTAPLFFAAIGGPVAILVYKAINTLDSTFGYKNDRYLEFGWASARLDDIANFVPARLTGMLVPFAALVLRLRFTDALWTFIRDRKKHPSPNSGQAEAAFAGALGVQLGPSSRAYGDWGSLPISSAASRQRN